MIVDTSALVAILRQEPDAGRFADAIEAAGGALLSAAGYVELGLVIDGTRDETLSAAVDMLLDSLNIIVVDVTETQARLAREAHQRFGRGSGHPAKLNFGDCFSYALAKDARQPLLFKGNDFAATDGIRLAEPAP